MWFKKREKEYTPEEAADIVRKELASYWFRSSPLLCGALVEDGTVNPQPLDPAIRKGIWVLIFTEVAGASLRRGKDVLKEWERRFIPVGVQFVFIFRSRYDFLKKRRSAENWLEKQEVKAAAFSDTTGLLARAFTQEGDSSESYPRVVILRNGEILFNRSGPVWLDGAEAAIAAALRMHSPGMPLLPLFQEPNSGEVSAGRWVPGAENDVMKGRVEFIGKWKKEGDHMITGDPSAEIRIQSPGNQITIIAQSYTEELTPTRIFYHSHGTYFSDQYAGQDFQVDDEGRSSVMIGAPQAYSVLRNLQGHQREVTFQFPNARVTSVSVYALEFADTLDQRK